MAEMSVAVPPDRVAPETVMLVDDLTIVKASPPAPAVAAATYRTEPTTKYLNLTSWVSVEAFKNVSRLVKVALREAPISTWLPVGVPVTKVTAVPFIVIESRLAGWPVNVNDPVDVGADRKPK